MRFPHRLNDVSPFGHVPQLPAAGMNWTPMVVLTVIAAALILAGPEGFRRCDLQTA